MKKVFFITVITIFQFIYCITARAVTVDFHSVCSTGQSLGYIILSGSSSNEVAVYANNTISGDLSIPEIVSNDGIEYTVTQVADMAFYGCYRLSTVSFPNTLTKIGMNAFVSCVDLEAVTFPENLASIGANSFSYCNGIKEIFSANSVAPDFGAGAFLGASQTIPIHVPSGCRSSYQSKWYYFNNFVEDYVGINPSLQDEYQVWGGNGFITINGVYGDNVKVFNAFGILIHNDDLLGLQRISIVRNGIYLVVINDKKTIKVLVR